MKVVSHAALAPVAYSRLIYNKILIELLRVLPNTNALLLAILFCASDATIVAINKYKCVFVDSAVLVSKYRLKCANVIHWLLVLTMALRLSVALYVMVGLRPPRTLQKLRLPAANNWEIVWLLGNVVTCLVGAVALLRNRPTLVRLYAAG